MNSAAVIFYILSAFVLISGLFAVISKKIFRSAIWLLSALIGIAGIYFWMEVEFIAAIQIVVYVGGIVVLIIFSIFLTQRSAENLPAPSFKRIAFSLLSVLAGSVFTLMLISRYDFQPETTSPLVLRVKDIGRQLMSTTDYGYIIPFEVVSILLLAAMIGCIVLAVKIPAVKENIVKQKELIEQ